MLDIIEKKLNYATRLRLSMNIIMGRLSLKAAQADYHLSRPTLRNIIQDIMPLEHDDLTNKVIIYKSVDSIYLDHNEKAGRLGPTHNNGNLRKNTDKDVAPQFADFYTACDQAVLQSKQVQVFTGDVVHKDLGVTQATAKIHPVYNDHADCQGILIVGNTGFSLSKQPFSRVLDHLHKGLAPYMLRQNQYEIKLNGIKHRFYQREAECLLYLMVGFSSKTIAKHMNLSPRTVENRIARLKEKLGVYSKDAMVSLLIKEQFLTKL